MIKTILLLALALFASYASHAQTGTSYSQQEMDSIDARMDSLMKIDYLSYDYKYLDENFTIHIDSGTFNETLIKYKFYPERIKKYKDSLAVVMHLEFNDYDQKAIAEMRVGYTWLRLSFHTWQREDEAKQFASYFGICHPWQMKTFLMKEDNHHPGVEEFYAQLKRKIKQEDATLNLNDLSREHLLDKAMRLNPERIAHLQKARERKGNIR